MTYRRFNKAAKTYNRNNLPQFINIYQSWFDKQVDNSAAALVKHNMYCISTIHNIQFYGNTMRVVFSEITPKVHNTTGLVLSLDIPRDAISHIE